MPQIYNKNKYPTQYVTMLAAFISFPCLSGFGEDSYSSQETHNHSSYKSQPSQPAVVYFFFKIAYFLA